jgi:3-hydroxyisobutyrate dehydrogenase-like beta-hydroxyacid dehydrogenase
MGAAIARRLVGSGHAVRLWNRSPDRAHAVAASLPSQRVQVAERADSAVAGCAVVIAMLADGAATRAVLLDPEVLSALRSDAVVCDLATSGSDTSVELAAKIEATGACFLDAPVSGSVPAVEAGSLLVMAGGSTAALDRARPVLAALADRIVTVGAPGAGQAMKLAVNLVVHTLNAALSESLVLAERSGIARENAYAVLEMSVVGAPFVHYKRPAFLDSETPVAMSLDLVAKDLRLITESARDVGASTSTADCARRVVEAACRAGFGSSDMADLSRYLLDSP